MNNTVLPAEDRAVKVAFQREVYELNRSIEGAQRTIGEVDNKLKHIREAIKMVEKPMAGLMADVHAINKKLTTIKRQLYGDPVKSRLDIDQPPTPATRLGWIDYEQKYSTSAPTKTHKESFAIAKEEFAPILKMLQQLVSEDLEQLEQKLEDADAPYTPGRAIKMLNRN